MVAGPVEQVPGHLSVWYDHRLASNVTAAAASALFCFFLYVCVCTYVHVHTQCTYINMWTCIFYVCKCKYNYVVTTTTKKIYIDVHVGMEKEQKQELGWRVSVLPIPAFHHCTVRYYNYVLQVHSIQWSAGMGNTDTLHPNSCFCSSSCTCVCVYVHACTLYSSSQ